jgi:hypothetical protein
VKIKMFRTVVLGALALTIYFVSRKGEHAGHEMSKMPY